MQRALRDRRFDSTVARLIRDKEFAAEADLARIDRMVQRYAEKAIRYRATMLAQYQTMQAANAGRLAAWSQYGRSKAPRSVVGEAVLADGGGRAGVPGVPGDTDSEPEGVPLGEKYVTPDGETTSPPEHGSCRCTERFEVDKGASQQSEPVPYGELRISAIGASGGRPARGNGGVRRPAADRAGGGQLCPIHRFDQAGARQPTREQASRAASPA